MSFARHVRSQVQSMPETTGTFRCSNSQEFYQVGIAELAHRRIRLVIEVSFFASLQRLKLVK